MQITSLNNSNDTKRKIVIPEGYRELLRDMTVDVLRTQPSDTISYCIQWLTERKSKDSTGKLEIQGEKPSSSKTEQTPEIKAEPVTPAESPAPAPVKKELGIHLGVMSTDQVVHNCKLFASLAESDLDILAAKGVTQTVNPGDEIIVASEGDPDKLYIVANGRFDLFADLPMGRIKLSELHNFGYFGDVQEILRCIAKTPGKVIVINRSDVSPDVFVKIQERREELKEFIEDMELFEKLSEYERRLVIDSLTEKSFEAGEDIIKEGEPGNEMYLLFEGFGSVIQEGKEISSVAEGGYFGEVALMEGHGRAATINAMSDVKVLTISIDVFKNLIEPKCRDYLNKEIERYTKDEDDYDDDDESDMETPPFAKVNMPRKSVSAGKFNPEMMEEDDEEEIQEELAKPELQKTEEQKVLLRKCCGNILLFRCLDDEQMEVVIGVMFPKEVEEGDIIIKLGDDGDNFYIIENGTYDIKVMINDKETVVAQFKDEGSFGELALMYNTPRNATIQAASKGKLWALSRDMFRKIVLKKAFQKRIMYEQLIGQVPLFTELSAYEKMNIADALRTRVYEPGTHVITQGDEGTDMYFIEEGRVEIFVDFKDGLSPELIGELERGKYFGEMALLTHKPRAATAIAKTKCKIAVLDRESFERLLGPCVEVMKRNMEGYNVSSGQKKSIINQIGEPNE